MESVLPDSNKINLVLYSERMMYSIGEPIRPKLQILNNTTQKIELGYGFIFDWENLAFAEPNFIHLVGSNRAELALPYCHEKSYFNSINPIMVDAGKQEWLYLPIYAHFHLHQPGKYSFWIELHDNNGELHHSNRISFRLVDIKASVPAEFIELTIKSRKSSFMATEPIDIEAVFTNKSDKPIIFLKPQEDSLDGWVNPVYQFTVVDNADHSLALALRCGSMATPVYNDSAQFIIASGGFYRQKVQLPLFPEMHKPGEYRVRLTYIVRDKAIGKGGVVLDKKMSWKNDVFVGRLESNEVTITIKGGV